MSKFIKSIMVFFLLTSLSYLVLADSEPVANFTIAPEIASCGTMIDFDASSSYHNNSSYSIIKYEWDFDYDGLHFNVEDSGISVNHTYSGKDVLGNHTVALKVTDDQNPSQTDIITKPIEMSFTNHVPAANAGGPYYTTYYYYDYQPVRLDASRSYDPDMPCDDIVEYQWDTDSDGKFGLEDNDGSLCDSVYDCIGKYPLVHNANWLMGETVAVSLRVKDSYGAISNPATTEISIIPLENMNDNPIALAKTSPLNLMEGCIGSGNGIVNFYSESYNPKPTDQIVEYRWLFDTTETPDFNAIDWVSMPENTVYNNAFRTSNSMNYPTYQYLSSGNYNVALQVINRLGNSDIYSLDAITVSPQPKQYPSSKIGGPYVLNESETLTLDGTSSTDPNLVCGDELSYNWDLNGDGVYDISGETPQISWTDLVNLLQQAGLTENDYLANPYTGLPKIHISLDVVDSTNLHNTNFTTLTMYANDFDKDGFNYLDDCDDSNPNINPDVAEMFNDGIDNNCDGIAENFTLQLTSGWNLASLPTTGLMNCSELDSISNYEILYQLNDSGNGWSACFAGMHEFSDLLFDLQKPFWIKTNLEESHSEEWTFDDEQTYNITEGWNLISYPWTEEKLIEDVLDASVSDKITYIYEFDNDTWKLWMKDVPVNPLQTMKPGKAYWIYSTNNFTMNFNSGIASQ